MGCCILGALVLSQLLVAWQAVKRHRAWMLIGGAIVAGAGTILTGVLVFDSADVGRDGWSIYGAICGTPPTQLADTQLGLLSGLAFGLLYATMALPLARLGDRWSRRGLIGACLAVWSVATALCGAAQGFAQLFLARVAVGTGEAGAGPSSHSLISDYFPPERRGTALGIYSMGIFIGAGLGLMLGGILLAHFGWRGAFVAAGLPGLIVSLLFVLTVREPRQATPAARPVAPPFRASFMTIARSGPIVAGAFGLGFSVFAIQALLNWLPALLVRQYGLAPQAAGPAFAPIVAISGIVGVVSGGLSCDRIARSDAAKSPLLMAAITFLLVPAGIAGLLSGNLHLLLAGVAIVFFGNAFIAGPSFALIQNFAPVPLRAFAAAVAGLIALILGNALGPFVAGVLSDFLSANGVADPLQWSLVACVGAASLGGCAYLLAALSVRKASTRCAAPMTAADHSRETYST